MTNTQRFGKYKVWMIQEGRTPEELIPIICVHCGKVMKEEADLYWNHETQHAFCSSSHLKKGAIHPFDEIQARVFAIEALKEMNLLIKRRS